MQIAEYGGVQSHYHFNNLQKCDNNQISSVHTNGLTVFYSLIQVKSNGVFFWCIFSKMTGCKNRKKNLQKNEENNNCTTWKSEVSWNTWIIQHNSKQHISFLCRKCYCQELFTHMLLFSYSKFSWNTTDEENLFCKQPNSIPTSNRVQSCTAERLFTAGKLEKLLIKVKSGDGH